MATAAPVEAAGDAPPAVPTDPTACVPVTVGAANPLPSVTVVTPLDPDEDEGNDIDDDSTPEDFTSVPELAVAVVPVAPALVVA